MKFNRYLSHLIATICYALLLIKIVECLKHVDSGLAQLPAANILLSQLLTKQLEWLFNGWSEQLSTPVQDLMPPGCFQYHHFSTYAPCVLMLYVCMCITSRCENKINTLPNQSCNHLRNFITLISCQNNFTAFQFSAGFSHRFAPFFTSFLFTER